jgi:NAD(P)-dependent dehydrogenase (short-subunit alcohol dehydrogenase family)
MTQRFSQKLVVVLGGNSGIGLASAREFAREGAQVIISGRDPETLSSAIAQIGHGVAAYRSDIADLTQITHLFDEIRSRNGRIDTLFINAGIATLSPVELVTEEDWDLLQNTNLKGAFFSVQRALPLMPPGSSIVLMGSIAALRGEHSGAIYAVSKAGVRALGSSLAAELATRGIRVNVVTPGPIETPLLGRIKGVPSESVTAMRIEMINSVPLKRLGRPEEVAAAVLFLASDAAEFVTGIELLVDGGVMNLWPSIQSGA